MAKLSAAINIQTEILPEILNANLKSIVVAVKVCINFYYPGLIVNFKVQSAQNRHAGGK